MAWVVDSCVLLDIALEDPKFGLASATYLAQLHVSVVACPVSQIEIAPQFGGQLAKVKHFLQQSGIEHSIDWIKADTEAASIGWNAYVSARRSGPTQKRPIADVQIGGFAMRFEGLITRNGDDFRRWFPQLNIVEPIPLGWE